MKFRRILAAMTAALASVAFFASCGGDDDADLEGTWWKASKTDYEIFINGKSFQKASITADEDVYVKFDGGTATTVGIEDGEVYYETETYVVKGGKITMDGESVEYKVSGKKLTITEREDYDSDDLSEIAEEFNYSGKISSAYAIMKAVFVKVSESSVPKATAAADDLKRVN